MTPTCSVKACPFLATDTGYCRAHNLEATIPFVPQTGVVQPLQMARLSFIASGGLHHG